MSDTIILLKRRWFSDFSTIGEMSIDGVFECFTLEPTFRAHGAKVMGRTAIPEGTYELGIYSSFHNKGLVPLLLGVPGFEWIEIHPGNYPKDTAGCVLVGKQRPDGQDDLILESRAAFAQLFAKIQEFLKSGKVFIQITNSNERSASA